MSFFEDDKNKAKKTEFVSVVWGYHKQLYTLSALENYHLRALNTAQNLGLNLRVVSISAQAPIEKDPHFPVNCLVERYRGWIWYIQYLLKHRKALIYANTFTLQSFIVPFICSRTIFMGHDSVKRKTWFKQLLQNFVLRRFAKVRVVTEEEKQFLVHHGMDSDRIAVVPLAIDTDHFSETSTVSKKGLVFLGNATPDKDVVTILKAVGKVREKVPEITLDIIGEIRDEQVKNLISQLQLHDIVKVHGFVTHAELPKLLNQFLICINSSISEGQCLAVYEAALCGMALCLPITLSFSGVFKDKALFHEVGDYEQLAKNIEQYYSTPEIIPRYQQACQEMIRNNYSSVVIDQQLKDLFSSI